MSFFEIGVLVALGLIYLSLESTKSKIDPLHDSVRQLGIVSTLLYDLNEKAGHLVSRQDQIEDCLKGIERELDKTRYQSLAEVIDQRLEKIQNSIDSLSPDLSELSLIQSTLDSIESNTFRGPLPTDDDI
ncbi:MAG: hypothetical protein RLZZ133_1670 [Pseudomonadota bacterium]|jgi:hypothetical protein